MTIMAIISAAILGTAAAAMENARRSRTQSLVSKISGLVLERWDSYSNRRVDISPAIIAQINALYPAQISAAQRGQMMADARLLALRELIKMEMPDRWSDVINQPLSASVGFSLPTMLASMPALSRTYYRRLSEIQQNNGIDDVASNQAAECLYLTVMYGTGDGEARTLFSSQDIGDADGDGAPEFIDGWGQPIQWVRWPAGFVSVLQSLDGNGNRPGDTDHDPFDIFQRDSPSVTEPPNPAYGVYPQAMRNAIQSMRLRNQQAVSASPSLFTAFRLVPLIFSIGPDEDSDVILDSETPVLLDPYAHFYGTTADLQLGQQLDQEMDGEGWRDNIYNHLNEY